MATPLTQFQKRMAARRGTSSIDKLSRQYQEQIKNITGEYETSFADYTKKRAEAMAPFESATEQYKKDYAEYQTSVEGYKGRLSDFQKKLEDVKANPLKVTPFSYIPKPGSGGSTKLISIPGVGNFEGIANLPSNYTMDFATNTLYEKRSAGSFTEKAPTAPTQPVAPEIPEFDVKPFEEKKALAEQTYKRETAERKAARIGAVSRKETRSLLSGVKA